MRKTTGQTLGYLHACAVGGVLVADVETIKRARPHPVICYDHDTNQAGFELVKRLQTVMPLEACTTPLFWGDKSDLDSFIRDFAQDHVAAWEGVKALIADRQPYGRIYTVTRAQSFLIPGEGQGRGLHAEAAGRCPHGARDLPLYRKPALDVSAWRVSALWGGALAG